MREQQGDYGKPIVPKEARRLSLITEHSLGLGKDFSFLHLYGQEAVGHFSGVFPGSVFIVSGKCLRSDLADSMRGPLIPDLKVTIKIRRNASPCWAFHDKFTLFFHVYLFAPGV